MQAYFYRDASGSQGGEKGGKSSCDRPHLQPPPRFGAPNDLKCPGPKLCAFVSPSPAAEDLDYLRQMGVTHCFTWLQHLKGWDVARLRHLRETVEAHGLVLNNVGCLELGELRHLHSTMITVYCFVSELPESVSPRFQPEKN